MSLSVFAVLEAWHASVKEEKYLQTEEQLTREISELEIHIVDLESALKKRNEELMIRNELIDEKNSELQFLHQELKKWKVRFYQQKESSKEEETFTSVSFLH